MSTTGHKHSSLIVSVAALCSASQTVHEYKQLMLDPSPRRQSKAENTMKDNVVSAKLFDTFTNFCLCRLLVGGGAPGIDYCVD